MSFGELMAEAGVNTLLGMGTVFCVLILISFIISLFKYLNKASAPKKEEKKDSVDKAVEQISANEDTANDDDTELAAVIAAAIAAYEGSKSASGYVVRSIRRVR